jgi:hypothetical protein
MISNSRRVSLSDTVLGMNVYVSTVAIKTTTHATRSNQVRYTARYNPLLQ